MKKYKSPRVKVKYKLCDQCDGCGWHEGGKFLQTTCEHCNGRGKIKIKQS